MPLMRSWVASANHADTDFPLNNLPCGVFSLADDQPRCGIAIGDQILDVAAMEAAGLLRLTDTRVLDQPSWNKVMALGPAAWQRLRIMLLGFLVEGTAVKGQVERYLVPQSAARLHLPLTVAGLTEFRADRGGKGPALPGGRNGRGAGVIVGGSGVNRPTGPRPTGDSGTSGPEYGPAAEFDFTVQLGTIVGTASQGSLNATRAEAMIFGHVLLNGWIAHDIAATEIAAGGAGPLVARAAGTTIGPWIVMAAALEPFRTAGPAVAGLPDHLQAAGPLAHAIEIAATVIPADAPARIVVSGNTRTLALAPAQNLAWLGNSGSPLVSGDLIASGAVCAARPAAGTTPFLADGDQVVLRGTCQGDGYRIGFGECRGRVLPARRGPAGA